MTLIGGYYDSHEPSGYLSVERASDGSLLGSYSRTYEDAMVSVNSYDDGPDNYMVWYWVPGMDDCIEGWVANEQGLKGVMTNE